MSLIRAVGESQTRRRFPSQRRVSTPPVVTETLQVQCLCNQRAKQQQAPRAKGDPNAAAARMYMTELRQTHSGHWSQIYGVYHDRFLRANGQWWFAHRHYHSLARNNLPASVFDFPHHLDLDEL